MKHLAGLVLLTVGFVIGIGNLVHAMAGSPWYRTGLTAVLAGVAIVLAAAGSALIS